jgi:hypothetical protein
MPQSTAASSAHYSTYYTRPELTFTVGYLSRFMEEPCGDHLAAVKRVLRYVTGTRDLRLFYTKQEEGPPKLIGFSDADLGGDIDTQRSTSGIVFFSDGNPNSWQSSKQKVVALSSCEAEYMAAVAAACQGVWLARLLTDMLGVESGTSLLLIDNQSAIALIKNPVFHDRSKHIDICFHFIRECIEEGRIKLDYVPTANQVVDVTSHPQAGMVSPNQDPYEVPTPKY